MSETAMPDPESLRAQLTELNIRSRTYTTQIWQVPFAYLGILSIAVVQAAGKLPSLLLALLLGSGGVRGRRSHFPRGSYARRLATRGREHPED